MPRVVVSLSGGIDSSVTLAYVKRIMEKAAGVNPDFNKVEIMAVGFLYGSKHNLLEMEAAKKIAAHYKVPHMLIGLQAAFRMIDSALLAHDSKPIPEGHYNDESMKATVVPGRNMIFASILAGIATGGPKPPDSLVKDFKGEVYLGIHAGDFAIYPDCRPEFFRSMSESVRLATHDGTEGVQLGAPFLHQKKQEIVAMGLKLGVPFEHTRTCYTSNELACGRCGSCTERLEAFRLNDATDPIPYAQ